ncbi:isoprenyl transferase [Geotalea uraniireducens]|uniref:Isoprenyl transferase n=1 Tax=Geotalea uraniireducens TaxID=351604 RepID=A0ABN6VT34_9BACT|nr:isoprenyl transferase [Geotalea uraniireducens]BDV43518.1 isoprenyl transferase [Geotalea uraniireducens]
MHGLKTDKLPQHLAIIMDGNGRWAQERMLKRIIGHQKGVETVRVIVEECSRLGIKYLTLFAFSAENWLRPKTEVKALMSLLKKYISFETTRMIADNIRFNVIGDRDELPPDVNAAVQQAIDRTAGNDGMVLTLALSYGSRQEIVRAAARLAGDIAAGTVAADRLDENLFSSYLFTGDMPDPDFLIRTSGEMRISNFLLWQLAYTELYFSDANWPEFTAAELHKALKVYQARERRFGRTSDQVNKRS